MKEFIKVLFITFGFLKGGLVIDSQAQILEEKVYKNPYKEISIIIAPEGYYPKNISLFTGEKVKVYLTSILDQNVSTCLMLPEKGLFMSVRRGEISEGGLFFKREGIYKFYCPTGKIEGKFIVLKKGKKRRMDIMSTKGPKGKVWMPKEK